MRNLNIFRKISFGIIVLFSLLLCEVGLAKADSITISSKTFTESYILAEIFAKTLLDRFPAKSVELNLGMGGTGILFEALRNGDIDLYPEYTGTIAEAILKNPKLKTVDEINKALLSLGLIISEPLGFNNTYAFAVSKKTARKYSLATISDLRKHTNLRLGFSYEFMERSDGYYPLAETYNLKHENVKAMMHSLSYEAIDSNAVDVIDIYTTDAKIKRFDLEILKDDLAFFPRYDAVILANINFVQNNPLVWSHLTSLESNIDEAEIIRLNALVEVDKLSFKKAAASFLRPDITSVSVSEIDYVRIWDRTKEHLFLVFVSLIFAILIGVPLGFFATCSKWLKQTIFAASGIVQTIPSLALLCFFIPIFGIGIVPSLMALFLYGLLPIVRNTCTGLESVDPKLKETSQVLGLNNFQRLLWVEVPLSMPSILAGIKTSAIVNVGTATLAAFIGSGGLGSFIVTGLALNDINIILHGAIPAALLALVMQCLFDIGDKFLIPKGIKP